MVILKQRQLPEVGYNTTIEPNMEDEVIIYTEAARKKTADFSLVYHDNVKGLYNDIRFDDGTITPTDSTTISALEDSTEDCSACNSTTAQRDADIFNTTLYNYGFELDVYLSDLIEDPETGIIHNRPDDNVRIEISDLWVYGDPEKGEMGEYTKIAAAMPMLLPWYKKGITKERLNGTTRKPNNISSGNPEPDRKYEFLSVDDTLNDIDLSDYTNFLNTFENYQEYLPQVVLLGEIIGKEVSSDDTAVETAYNSIVDSMLKKFIALVGENEDAFLYGASFDDLEFTDIEYVLGEAANNTSLDLIDDEGNPASESTSYAVAEIKDAEGDYRKIRNSDQILGTSMMEVDVGEEKNRVFYLDPALYGGKYVNPPLYIKPVKAKGWLGLLDVLFPEVSACQPYTTDLIDFNDIQQK